MAKMVSLGTLKTKIREQADMVNSEYVSDEELTRYINGSVSELYGLLVRAYGEDYVYEETSVIVPAGAKSVDLPDNYAKHYWVEYEQGGKRVEIRQFQMRDRNIESGPYKHRVMGKKLYLNKAPTSDLTIYMAIVPVYTDMTDDEDEFDFVMDWEEYVVADVCLKMMAKQQDDLTYYVAKKQEQLDRIEKERIGRNLAEPQIMVGFNEFDVDDDWGIY